MSEKDFGRKKNAFRTQLDTIAQFIIIIIIHTIRVLYIHIHIHIIPIFAKAQRMVEMFFVVVRFAVL